MKASFDFIHSHPVFHNNSPLPVHIDVGISLLKDQSSTNKNRKYAITSITGVVQKVCSTYVILKYENKQNEIIETTISYRYMLDVASASIQEYFEEYIKKVNSVYPICYTPGIEAFDILTRLSSILQEPISAQRPISFLLNGILSAHFNPSSIAILGNLIIVDEIFIVPITAIAGFIQLGSCNI